MLNIQNICYSVTDKGEKKEILKDIFEVKNILITKIDQEFLKYINK